MTKRYTQQKRGIHSALRPRLDAPTYLHHTPISAKLQFARDYTSVPLTSQGGDIVIKQILQMIQQAEQDIHQELQQIPRHDTGTRAHIGMNRLTVLKNDIRELLSATPAHHDGKLGGDIPQTACYRQSPQGVRYVAVRYDGSDSPQDDIWFSFEQALAFYAWLDQEIQAGRLAKGEEVQS